MHLAVHSCFRIGDALLCHAYAMRTPCVRQAARASLERILLSRDTGQGARETARTA